MEEMKWQLLFFQRAETADGFVNENLTFMYLLHICPRTLTLEEIISSNQRPQTGNCSFMSFGQILKLFQRHIELGNHKPIESPSHRRRKKTTVSI